MKEVAVLKYCGGLLKCWEEQKVACVSNGRDRCRRDNKTKAAAAKLLTSREINSGRCTLKRKVNEVSLDRRQHRLRKLGVLQIGQELLKNISNKSTSKCRGTGTERYRNL